jgi:phosphoglycerate dehydrogenase-like enzyme
VAYEDYLTANNITFFSAQGCNSMAVAEFIISAIVNLADEFGLSAVLKSTNSGKFSVFLLQFKEVITLQ